MGIETITWGIVASTIWLIIYTILNGAPLFQYHRTIVPLPRIEHDVTVHLSGRHYGITQLGSALHISWDSYHTCRTRLVLGEASIGISQVVLTPVLDAAIRLGGIMDILISLALVGTSFGLVAAVGGLFWCWMIFSRYYRKNYRYF